jgi:hypothetical protein
MSKVITALAGIPLGEAAMIDGIHVIRRSLLGFQVADLPDLVEAAEAAEAVARIAAAEKGKRPASPLLQAPAPKTPPQKRPIVRVLICTRCVGDGLGRRDRGACGLCHGRGVQLVMPLGGFPEAPAEELASAVDQALVALVAAAYPCARDSLLELLGAALPFAPAALKERALTEIRRTGFEAAAAAMAAAAGASRAA